MTWKQLLSEEFEKEYFKKIISFIQADAKSYTILPHHDNLFTAFKLTPLSKVKVVILGQDPYFNPGQAHGLAFSVLEDCPVPASLRNIFKEINTDLGLDFKFPHGNLTSWARQGVLLINTILTVRQGCANSHKNIGWETFSNRVISRINEEDKPIVYLLWGKSAKDKINLITNKKHLVLSSAHPSPLSASNGFFGCKHFSQTNKFLSDNKLEPIDWL
jgi:uracil-DNA glycosylase